MERPFKRYRHLITATFILILSGCAIYAGVNYDSLYGKAKPQPRIVELNNSAAEHYLTEVKPIIDKRCVVCHACYDAPCQLKLSSPEGIDRGSDKNKIYHGTRLTEAELTRLFIDAQSTEEWRNKGFSPVLNERLQVEEANTQAAVLARMLTLKQNNPLPEEKILKQDEWDFSLDRNQQCPTMDEMAKYEQEKLLWGMPYGLPQVDDHENEVLMNWVAAGGIMADSVVVTNLEKIEIEKWESFLNGDSLKQQVTSRYIFEHLYVSNIYFSDLIPEGNKKQPNFFKLVRSTTPPGQAVDIIATRRPYNDPGVERVYYRLIPVLSTIVDKTHMPYRFSNEKLSRINELFFETKYEVTKLPSYESKVAANPLTAFTELPIEARYRFMLDEAQNTIMAYIKGPVCRGQLALNVINDRFWVFFIDPANSNMSTVNKFFTSQEKNLRLPAEKQSIVLPITTWTGYAKEVAEYIEAKNTFLDQQFKEGNYLTPYLIWDGDGNNSNAALTVFRHFDSATVTKGLVGDSPKTAWIIDYSLIERIHYLLVAGFDVYGNYGHQLVTRMYMDFLRMEGESNFLVLLPPEERTKELTDWYQDADLTLTKFIGRNIAPIKQPPNIEYSTDNPKEELFHLLKARVAPVHMNRYDLNETELSENAIEELNKLNQLKGKSASIFPEITSIMVMPTDKNVEPQLFTLLRNSAHKNISSLFDEKKNRLYNRDTVTLVRGVLGSYPEAFWLIDESDLPKLTQKVLSVTNETQYSELLDEFGIRRTNPDFWSFSDQYNEQYKKNHPISSGLLDYNRLQNR
ncbi:fatty acid cis/trans isomerase [Vibrio sp. SS-MA-C1-2]|uniref:fatty acid cis/trans isomerase n=1 Tax=Vibrio sp. SS-MA-C1-2 TaxID=2908646 RepID=UPI001F24B977|nr:fatty acid cis/trans isomerase [Vibrio sp. SS-MA-C1-2]UJF17949.1 fatty acid cis/trans isomerase [Vibrio sp. SS-MA-C1-2]